MSKAQEIRDFIKSNPGKNIPEIARGVSWTTDRVSASLWADAQRARPTIRKEYDERNNTFVHFFGPAAPQPTPAAPVLESEIIPRSSLDQLAHELSLAMATAVAAMYKEHLTAALKNLMPTTMPEPGRLSLQDLVAGFSTPPEQTPRKLPVLIAGLKPNQAGIISAEFGQVFDLRFFGADSNMQQLPDMLRGVDHIFTFTSFISHKIEDVMKRMNKKINRCSGGMTMLKDRLTALYAAG